MFLFFLFKILTKGAFLFQLHDLEADFEQQKFDLQKLHTRNIQEILDDTNSRLQRMETEYSQQASSTVSDNFDSILITDLIKLLLAFFLLS